MSSEGKQPTGPSLEDDRLDFEQAEESMTSSWQRALEEAAEIEPMEPGEYAVRFETSDTTHVVHLIGDGRGYVGRCMCPGYQYHDGPCAHLCLLYQRSLEEPDLVPEVRI